jgi:hypothetical protein
MTDRAELAHKLSVIAHNACNGSCRHDVGLHLMGVVERYVENLEAELRRLREREARLGELVSRWRGAVERADEVVESGTESRECVRAFWTAHVLGLAADEVSAALGIPLRQAADELTKEDS